MDVSGRSLRLVGVVLVAYTLLVSTHLGEFWPFSIYPMFSQAGVPWTRSLVRELPSDFDPSVVDWRSTSLDSLSGKAYPLVPQNINQNDVANYLSKAGEWTEERVAGLRGMFTKGRTLQNPLLLYRARGELDGDSVSVSLTPVMLLAPDTTYLNPDPAARLPGRTVADPSRRN